MPKNARVAVFVDGSNLYYKLRDQQPGLANLLKYDYAGLCSYIAENREITQKNYYVGVVKVDPKSKDRQRAEKMRQQQTILFGHLRSKKQGFTIKRGFLMKNEGVYHEKGVDVEIAVDIVVGAYENLYDTAILLSSDTDLIPAMKVARSKGKKVEYIGFSTKPSFGMQSNADISRLLGKGELVRFAAPERKKKTPDSRGL